MAIAPDARENDAEALTEPPAPAVEPAPPAAEQPVAEPPAAVDPATSEQTNRAAAAAAVAAVVSADPNLVSTTVALPTDALEFLRSQSTKNGTSTGDELRRSIGTQKFLQDKLAEGATLQLRDAKGNLFDVKI
ncbi:hypothetical protein FPZ24_09060 [Sphingomonas panacisoli]|uniref:Uncharacterized protein n=1 Tax=Sphingomonas panacisoli TaxID=1813879 RepID=A0A5B8LKK7_9SPHN|nr:hypothetical protein [Sphingomonas panacisoli]QDZ07620.1 hypothetical protein FPZ24_09060 [Sphingomonas panacisoli]